MVYGFPSSLPDMHQNIQDLEGLFPGTFSISRISSELPESILPALIPGSGKGKQYLLTVHQDTNIPGSQRLVWFNTHAWRYTGSMPLIHFSVPTSSHPPPCS